MQVSELLFDMIEQIARRGNRKGSRASGAGNNRKSTPNSLCEGPAGHFRSSGEGITNIIIKAGRMSSYVISIATPKKKDKTDIDEATWSSLYSTTSHPFDPSGRGKIAIKVINHHGGEVLKMHEVK